MTVITSVWPIQEYLFAIEESLEQSDVREVEVSA